jgi:hypothetical protein
VSATFWSRIMISRGFEAVNTVFGGYFGFGRKKKRSLRERDVVKHGPYTAPCNNEMLFLFKIVTTNNCTTTRRIDEDEELRHATWLLDRLRIFVPGRSAT